MLDMIIIPESIMKQKEEKKDQQLLKVAISLEPPQGRQRRNAGHWICFLA
jgi:hypothetical protein